MKEKIDLLLLLLFLSWQHTFKVLASDFIYHFVSMGNYTKCSVCEKNEVDSNREESQR